MGDVYENYKDYRINSLIESEVIRRNFNWENAAEKGYEILKDIESNNHFFDIKGTPTAISNIIREIYDENVYDRYFEVEKDDIVVDIGAHIGLFSRYAIEKGAKKCFAIEPLAESYDNLLENIKPEKYINKIDTLNKAIYHSNESVFFGLGPRGGTIGARISPNKTDDVVSGIKFKDYIKSLNVEKIDYLKVDCEGGEYDIFTDENLDYIENNVKKIAGEFHKTYNKYGMNEAIKILEKLEGRGFDIWVESYDGINIKEQLLKNHWLKNENKHAVDYYTEIYFWALNKKFNVNVDIDFIDGVKVTIHGRDVDYKVDFIDGNSNKVLYSNTIGSGQWTKCFIRYYVNWLIRVSVDDEIVYEYKLDLTNKKVHIHFGTKALGDTLAWIPYVEEFRKKHNCEVVCTTFWNRLFKEQYTDIEFIEPGSKFTISSGIPLYEIGWFYNGTGNLNDIRTIPLQQTSSDILGLDYKEIRPKLKLGHERPIEEKYVCISIQSTSQCKYWNCPNGWQKVVDYLNEIGYKVVCIDKYRTFGKGVCWNTMPSGLTDDSGDKPLERRIQYLEHCEFFIGIGSGLSWLAWACKAKVILISSFSKPFCEFQFDCIRIYNDNEKSGYFNNKDFILDPGDWNWNPLKEIKSMDGWYEFETITSEQVIKEIEKSTDGKY